MNNMKLEEADFLSSQELHSRVEDILEAKGIRTKERTKCEVWTRVMGYHRPTTSFNLGKLQEHEDRKKFCEPTTKL